MTQRDIKSNSTCSSSITKFNMAKNPMSPNLSLMSPNFSLMSPNYPQFFQRILYKQKQITKTFHPEGFLRNKEHLTANISKQKEFR